LPWARASAQGESSIQGRTRSASHAEGSLRELLKSTDFDRKGKGVDRTGWLPPWCLRHTKTMYPVLRWPRNAALIFNFLTQRWTII
jgi:hypothetical protein